MNEQAPRELSEQAVSREDLAELADKVKDDVTPAIIRTECTVTQLERRLSSLSEKVRRLEDEMKQLTTDNEDLCKAIVKLQEKFG